MRLTIYYCFSIIFILTSCISVPKNVIKNFDYCYDGKNTGLDSLLNLNGFYYLGEDFNYSTNGEFIFYKNGFIQFVTGKYRLEENFDDSTEYGSYGAYTLSNDTIKAQIISSPEGMGVIEYKIWFRIIDFNSLELLYRGRLSTVTNNDIRDFKKKIKNDEFYQRKGNIYKFSALKNISSIDKTYIINKKWFWCNEEDFKNWKNKSIDKSIN